MFSELHRSQRWGVRGLSSGCTNPPVGGPPHAPPHSGLDSCLLEAQTSEPYSLGLGSEGFQIAQLEGALLVKAIVEPGPSEEHRGRCPCGSAPGPLLLAQISPAINPLSVRDGEVIEGQAQPSLGVCSAPVQCPSSAASTLTVGTMIPLPQAEPGRFQGVCPGSAEDAELGRQIEAHVCHKASLLPLPVEHPGACFA